jgi:multidrug resistance efflux pump
MTPPADPKLHEVRAPPPPSEAAARPGGRRRVLVGAGLVAVVVALAIGAHALLTRGEESTDDAQVEADVVAIAPRVAGPVAEVLVADNAAVRQGQPLVRIDPSDYQVRVRQAEAELATAQLRRSLDAFARLDAAQALAVLKQDDQIDQEFDGLMRKLVTYMMEDPRTISASIDLVFVAKAIERVGDHAKNLAEATIYVVKGRDVRHATLGQVEDVVK